MFFFSFDSHSCALKAGSFVLWCMTDASEVIVAVKPSILAGYKFGAGIEDEYCSFNAIPSSAVIIDTVDRFLICDAKYFDALGIVSALGFTLTICSVFL